MTVITKQPVNPTAHLTPEDIEQLGVELDAIRQDVLDEPRRARRGVHPPGRSTCSAALELGSRAVLLGSALPPAWVRRHRRPLGRQDPREHGDRPQRPARPVGLDARPEDPLHDLGVGQRRRRPSSGSTRTTRSTTPTRTSSARTTTSATASCASTRTSAGTRATSSSRSWNFINACFFEYGIAAYDLELGRNLRIPQGEAHRRSSRPTSAKAARQDPQAGHQGLRRQPGAVRCRSARSCRPWPPTSPPTWSATCGRHSVIMCGHFPEGVETFEREVDPRRTRPAASGTSARCSARPTSPAPRPCT